MHQDYIQQDLSHPLNALPLRVLAPRRCTSSSRSYRVLAVFDRLACKLMDETGAKPAERRSSPRAPRLRLGGLPHPQQHPPQASPPPPPQTLQTPRRDDLAFPPAFSPR